MSRHLWNAGRARADDPAGREPEPQHLGIFAATIRAVKGLTGRSASDQSPTPSDIALPVPRPAAEDAEPSLPAEEITQEIPRYVEMEPTEPALSMLSRGRHGMR